MKDFLILYGKGLASIALIVQPYFVYNLIAGPHSGSLLYDWSGGVIIELLSATLLTIPLYLGAQIHNLRNK